MSITDENTNTDDEILDEDNELLKDNHENFKNSDKRMVKDVKFGSTDESEK